MAQNKIKAADIGSTTGTGDTVVLSTSPTLVTAALGSSTATTQAANDNSTKVATTAYVRNAVIPAGSNTQIQYNNSNVFGADANFTWNGSNFAVRDITIASGYVLNYAGQGYIRTTTTALTLNDSNTNGVYLVTGGGTVGIGSPSVAAQKLTIFPSADATIGQVIRLNSATTSASAFEVRNSSNVVLSRIDQYGGISGRTTAGLVNGSGMLDGWYLGQANGVNNSTGSSNAIASPSERFRGGRYRGYTITTSGSLSANCDVLFQGQQGNTESITAATTGVITIDFNPFVGWTVNVASGYTYLGGKFIFNFFNVSGPDTVLIEAYVLTGGTDQWVTLKNLTGLSTPNPLVIEQAASFVYIKRIRISMSCATAAVLPQSIEYYPYTTDSGFSELVNVSKYDSGDQIMGVKSLQLRDINAVVKTAFTPQVANGAAAVAYTFDTTNALSTDGAKIASFKTNNVEKAFIDKDGSVSVGLINSTGFSRVSSQFDKTSDTSLANITGLTATLIAGKTYDFEAILYTTSNIAGGVKFAIAGTATATAMIYEAVVDDGGIAVATGTRRTTTKGNTVGDVTAVTAAYVRITGLITVNAAGTLTVQFAQNASSLTASSILVGSTFKVKQIT